MTDPSDRSRPDLEPSDADRRAPISEGTASDPHDGQVILVRRRRAPALGLWVLIALALPFLAGMVVAWAADVRTLTGMLYFGVTAALLVGFPLALVAAIVDSVLDRRRRRSSPPRPPAER